MAAISPDGRYVVHVKVEEGGPGLWTRQTAATSDVRIVAPADVRFDGLAFTPDGNYIYYSYYPTSGQGTAFASLYKVPVLGGTPSQGARRHRQSRDVLARSETDRLHPRVDPARPVRSDGGEPGRQQRARAGAVAGARSLPGGRAGVVA